MDKIPFTIYDIFGYVIPGTILVFSINYFFPELNLFSIKEPTIIEGVIAFFLLYVAGHLIATPSALLLETLFVKKYLKDPRFLLLNTKINTKGFKKLFPGHFVPIEEKVRRLIHEKFQIKGRNSITEIESKAIYQFIFSKVKKDESAVQRLNIFLNLYGFARNISFTCLLLALTLLIDVVISKEWRTIYWVIGYLLISIIMLYRFLKFYRHYNYELYLSYIS